MKTLMQLLDETKKQIQEINVDQAREILRQGGAVFVDVREPAEYAGGVVKGAARVPRGLLELQIEKLVPDRNQALILYCAGGVRSALAAKSLQDMGYKNVQSLRGGFVIWEASEYEIEN